MEEPTLKPRFDYKNLIVWIILVTSFWGMFVFSLPGSVLTDGGSLSRPLIDWIKSLPYMPDATLFTVQMYLATLTCFLGAIVYTAVTKRNRFIFRSFLPKHPGNTVKMLLLGLLVGFLMNFGCIVCALIHGDIHLYLNFSLNQIPFYLFALVCVFIQSSSEELWTRGFMYERINVRYPLWVAMAVNGIFFGLLHAFNSGVTVFAVVEIAVCGISFSLAKWYTGSIWFPMTIHTAWNFTQNFLFGLPNSGLVSEASIFGLDAATARSSAVYDVGFGVEGAIPSLISDGLLGVICLILAIRQGRGHELLQTQVTPKKDPDGPQPLLHYDEPVDETAQWHAAEEAGEAAVVDAAVDASSSEAAEQRPVDQ